MECLLKDYDFGNYDDSYYAVLDLSGSPLVLD